MYCDNCGNKISEEGKFCRFCGKQLVSKEVGKRKEEKRNKSYLNRLFSSGRLNRRNFIIGAILTIILWGILIFAIYFALGFFGLYHENSDNWIMNVTYVFLLFYWISICARRLHDLGYSGWYQLANFIPIAGLILYIYLIFVSGKKESNIYGEVTESKIDLYDIFGLENN